MSLEHLLLSWSPKKKVHSFGFSVIHKSMSLKYEPSSEPLHIPSAEEDDEVLIEGRAHQEDECRGFSFKDRGLTVMDVGVGFGSTISRGG